MSIKPDFRQRSIDMHRRAQKAEGELQRMKAAHAYVMDGVIKTSKYINYFQYGFMLLNCYSSLFPKNVDKP